jgi:hypothetical protein
MSFVASSTAAESLDFIHDQEMIDLNLSYLSLVLQNSTLSTATPMSDSDLSFYTNQLNSLAMASGGADDYTDNAFTLNNFSRPSCLTSSSSPIGGPST